MPKQVISHKVEVVSPKPSVILSNYVIGDNQPSKQFIKVDDHINVNKTPVGFAPLKYVEEDSSHGPAVRTPVNVVTVPQVSTAKPTVHKVARNEVVNQSNIPSVKKHSTRSST